MRFTLFTNILCHRYENCNPQCDKHVDDNINYEFVEATDNTGAKTEYKIIITSNIGNKKLKIATMHVYNTKNSVLIQGSSENVRAFVDNHLSKLIDLTNHLYDITSRTTLNVSDIMNRQTHSIDNSNLCITCQETAETLSCYTISSLHLPETIYLTEATRPIEQNTPTVQKSTSFLQNLTPTWLFNPITPTNQAIADKPNRKNTPQTDIITKQPEHIIHEAVTPKKSTYTPTTINKSTEISVLRTFSKRLESLEQVLQKLTVKNNELNNNNIHLEEKVNNLEKITDKQSALIKSMEQKVNNGPTKKKQHSPNKKHVPTSPTNNVIRETHEVIEINNVETPKLKNNNKPKNRTNNENKVKSGAKIFVIGDSNLRRCTNLLKNLYQTYMLQQRPVLHLVA